MDTSQCGTHGCTVKQRTKSNTHTKKNNTLPTTVQKDHGERGRRQWVCLGDLVRKKRAPDVEKEIERGLIPHTHKNTRSQREREKK